MDSALLLCRAKEKLGISSLTPFQKQMSDAKLPAWLLLTAPTGSGKTLAFALPFLRSLKKGEGVRGLVIVPTRELALQVFEVVRSLTSPDFKTAVLYGGHSFDAEVKSLGGAPSIIVATPGRLLDHVRRGTVNIFGVTSLVLDEYDKSLELGFLPDMKAIAGRLKNLSTTILTSATELSEIPDFLGHERFKKISFDICPAANSGVLTFQKVQSPASDKLETLENLLRDLSDKRTIIFVNHRDAAERVYKHLKTKGFPAGLYHGGLEQDERERALILLENGTTPILVSTDLASRGLDINDLEAVIHYHLPVSPEALTHRNGRTARMGASGEAFAIISDTDKIPDFFPTLEEYWPEGTAQIAPSQWATLHFNVGKKEKISRGDIAGFLIQKGGLSKEEVGRIDIRDHQAYVAVPASKARSTVVAVAPYKIKNTRARITQLK